MKKTIGMVTLVFLSISSGIQAAGFDGAEVTATGYCCTAPIESNRTTVPLTETVGPAIEFPVGSIQASTGLRIASADIDIQSSSITYVFKENINLLGGKFDGGVFDFSGSNLPAITGVSLDPRSDFAPSSIGLSFDTDTVRINLSGLHVLPSSVVAVDVMFAPVPEPETYAMFLAGLGILGWRMRKIKS